MLPLGGVIYGRQEMLKNTLQRPTVLLYLQSLQPKKSVIKKRKKNNAIIVTLEDIGCKGGVKVYIHCVVGDTTLHKLIQRNS